MSGPTLQLLDENDLKGRPLFRLIDSYEYPLGPGATITVPAGYVTNFGTIPRWFSWVVSPGQLREAAIVHDYMCNEAFSIAADNLHSGYSRWMADAVLYEGMGRLGFRWPKRFAVWAGVRIWAIFSGNTTFPAPPKS